MRIARALLPLLLLSTAMLNAQTPAAANQTPTAKAILAVLDRQVADWNRGDIDAFATGYKNSPDILFIGRTINRGYAEMVANYHKGYPTKERMGVLSFSQLEVQPLDARFATATGHFHIEASAAAGGNSDGYFLLVWEKTADGWKVVRDDTTGLPQPKAK
ncbi:Ketosteroid isomerase homolog [Granulicella rosea]|uniref:Ketosteroid isomerase homolog n=1 Tax=Granulicella rosea TaxID=474952 RepID=A0A239DAU2_9BACT|nr:nuclear transport factor 2 family protein [Granulicella rosea]SNS29440.1 Ketosteroid isomerase homolog [Granulicella rosea]